MTTSEPTEQRPYAVVGATGLQGGATTRALVAAGVPVRALTRNPKSDSGLALAELGAEVMRADLEDLGSLREPLTGVSGLFVMTTPGARGPEGEEQNGRTIAKAAADVGVPHVVYSSVGGAERDSGVPHFDSKRHVEQYMQELGLRAVFVRPVFFMDNFAKFMVPTLEDGVRVVRMPLPADVPLQLVAAADVGAVCAAATIDPDRVAGGAIEIAGDELTGDQIAEAYSRRYDVPARYEALPVETLRENFDMHAMFSWFTKLPAYQADFEGTRALAPTTHTFDQWLAEQGDLP